MKKFFEKLVAKVRRFLDSFKPTDNIDDPDVPDVPDTPGVPSTPSGADEIDFSSIRWFGSPSHAKAVTVQDCIISDLVVGSKLTFKYKHGGCEAFGATSKSDASYAHACFGYLNAQGIWVMAKADWISTSRTSRDFANVDSGYNHFDAAAFRAAKQYAFCIAGVTSAGGGVSSGKRSNVIFYLKK